jgi:phage terminase large subunit-like protein
MITRDEAKKIVERERQRKSGADVRPLSDREKKLLIARINYEKTDMGFFDQFVSPRQARLFEKMKKKRQVVWWGGIRSTKTNGLMKGVCFFAGNIWPVSYTEYFTPDGQKVLKPKFAPLDKPIIKTPANIAICVLDRQLQKKPGGVEDTLLSLLPTQWIAKIRRVADYIEYIVLKNGTKIWFLSGESGVDKMQSAAYDLVVFDETPDKKVYSELTSRVGRRAPRILMGFYTNKGRNWTYNDLIKKFDQGKAPSYLHVERISILDNPFIPLATKEEMFEQWKAQGEYEKRVWGGWDDFEGIVFKNFDKAKNVIAAADVPGFIGGFPPPEWPIISGLDCHHTEKGAACGWITINPENGRMYFFKEYLSKDEPAKWFEELTEIDKKFPSRITAADPAIDATDNRHFNLWTEFRRHCTLPLVKANRDHAQGIQAIRQALAPLRDENQKVVDGLPGLFILDHCVTAIEQIESYQYKSGGVGDVVKKNDEFCDIIRYMLMLRPQETFVNPKPGKKVSEEFTPDKKRGAFIYNFGDPDENKSKRKGAFLYSPQRPNWGKSEDEAKEEKR